MIDYLDFAHLGLVMVLLMTGLCCIIKKKEVGKRMFVK